MNPDIIRAKLLRLDLQLAIQTIWNSSLVP
jgi:hypothetical protein